MKDEIEDHALFRERLEKTLNVWNILFIVISYIIHI